LLLPGGAISVLDTDGQTRLVALVSRLGDTQAFSSADSPLGRSYDLTDVGVRVLPDSADDLPHLPVVQVTQWESDARQLAAGDAETRYGWIKDGDRPG